MLVPVFNEPNHLFVARMLSVLCTKPLHLPILIAMGLVLFIPIIDARMPKRTRGPSERHELRHHPFHQGGQTTESHDSNDGTPSPASEQELITGFSQRMLKEFGELPYPNSTVVASDFQGEFDQLNVYTHGRLLYALTELFEIRLTGLQRAVQHARKMKDAVRKMVSDGSCLFCHP